MLHIAAGAGDARQRAVGHPVGLPLRPVGDVALAELAHHCQRRRFNVRQFVRQVLRTQIGQRFQHHMARRLPHLPDVPLVMLRGGGGADPASAGGARPALHALILHQAVVVLVGCHAGEIVGRGAGGHGVQPFRVLISELQGDGAADGFANQMHSVQRQVIQQVAEVGGEPLQRPVVARRRHGGAAKPARVQPDDPVLPGQQRRPGIPEPSALGVAVMQHDGFHPRRVAPRVGKVVVVIVHFQIAGERRNRHNNLLLLLLALLRIWRYCGPDNAADGAIRRPTRRPGSGRPEGWRR